MLFQLLAIFFIYLFNPYFTSLDIKNLAMKGRFTKSDNLKTYKMYKSVNKKKGNRVIHTKTNIEIKNVTAYKSYKDNFVEPTI